MISTYKAGDVIYRAHDKPKGVFIVHTGKVEIQSKTGILLATLKEGEIFGEISEILAEPRSVTTIAKTNCSIKHIKANTIENKLKDTDPAIKGIIRALALRLSETDQKYEALWDELQIYKSLK
tara:strand:+ start:95 stop:463 length:369 start_codon:yes stop_codon:yes gene_type:complete